MMPSCSINCDTTFEKLPTDCTGSMTTETISFETIHLRPRSFQIYSFETNSFQIYSFETNSFEITIIWEHVLLSLVNLRPVHLRPHPFETFHLRPHEMNVVSVEVVWNEWRQMNWSQLSAHRLYLANVNKNILSAHPKIAGASPAPEPYQPHSMLPNWEGEKFSCHRGPKFSPVTTYPPQRFDTPNGIWSTRTQWSWMVLWKKGAYTLQLL